MRYVAFILLLLLCSCVSQQQFRTAGLDCYHSVSATLFGTAQTVHCRDNASQLVTNAVLPGTAIVEPIEKVVEAGTIAGGGYGILRNAPTVKTNNTVRIAP